MLTSEDMKALQSMMETVIDEKLKPIRQDISNMKKDITGMKQDISDIREDLAEVREHAEITRGATNYLVEWVEGLEKKVDRAM